MRELRFVGTSREDLKAFPEDVCDEIGHALWIAQQGGMYVFAKPLRGFGGASVIEIMVNDGDAYRAVYTVAFKDALYVLHCFQKKSTKGVATSQRDLGLIRQRLNTVREQAGG